MNREQLEKTINDLQFQVIVVNKLLESDLSKEAALIITEKINYLEADLNVLYNMFESELNAFIS